MTNINIPEDGTIALLESMNAFTVPQRVGLDTLSPSYATFAVHDVKTTLNSHAYEDWSTLSETINPVNGYASYDAFPVLSGSGDVTHLVGFQSRPRFAGTGHITNYFDGLNSAPVVSGGGVVQNLGGLHIWDVSNGSGGAPVGTIINNDGIHIESITRGLNNYAIRTELGKIRFGDVVSIVNPAAVSTLVSGLKVVQNGTGIGTGSRILAGYGDGSALSTMVGINGYYDGNGPALGLFAGTSNIQYLTISSNGGMGFFAHAPAPQPTKAGHNNWASHRDIVKALVEIGVLDME
jgi:hypothetical protein